MVPLLLCPSAPGWAWGWHGGPTRTKALGFGVGVGSGTDTGMSRELWGRGGSRSQAWQRKVTPALCGLCFPDRQKDREDGDRGPAAALTPQHRE